MSRTPRQAIEEALRDGVTRIAVANFLEGVVLPREFDSQVWVPLSLSLSFGDWAVPVFRADRFEVVLRFNGGPFECTVPYGAVGRVLDKAGAIQVFHCYGKVRDGAFAGHLLEQESAGTDVAVSKEQRPVLRVIKGGLS